MHALRRLRLQEAIRTVWTDAICINQQDNAEKSHQVPLMGSIYSLAKRVVVWLGQGDVQQTRRAFECSEIIASACHQFDQERGIKSSHWERHEEVHLPRRHFSALVLSSLQELYDRAWFTRIWCIQEIRLARDAVVVWGDDEISWTNLAVSASWIFDKTDPLDVDSLASLLVEIPVKNADMMRDKDMYPLLEALAHFRESEASNPRDKVYGLLNLVSPRCEVEALNVDYDKSVGEVYADTVLVVIRLYSRLTAFAHITHPVNYDGPGPEDYTNLKDYKGISEHRSWAPRWDDTAVARKLGDDEADCPWSACGANVAAVTVENPHEPTRLCLKGVVYDRVYEVGDIMDFHNQKDPEYIGDLKSVCDDEHSDGLVPDAEDVYVVYDPTERHPYIKAFERTNVESSPERFARTLTAGCWGRAGQYLERFSTEMLTRHSAACVHVLLRLLHVQEFGDEGEYLHSADSLQFERDAYSTCEQRRMFWTEKKSYGLGPHCMRSGDIVVVLYGGNTPYVLRPRGNEYIFMGQAYVDEIMNGELFHDSGIRAPQEQIFCLI